MEHTKGKWTTHNDINGAEILFADLGDDKLVTLGRIYTGKVAGQRGNGIFPSWEEGLANARHIVHCVNTHDELVDICKELTSIFPEESISELDAADFKDRANRIWVVALEAKQALIKAKGGV